MTAESHLADLEKARATLLEHSRSKRNGVFPKNFSHTARMINPICGDQVEIKILLSNEMRIEEIGFATKACAICSAATSLVCERIVGKPAQDILKLSDAFESTLAQPQRTEWPKELASLHCFEHLRINPSRKACAILPWIALKKAIKTKSVFTEPERAP